MELQKTRLIYQPFNHDTGIWQRKKWILLDMDGTLVESRIGKAAHPILLILLLRRLRTRGYSWTCLFRAFRDCLDGFSAGHGAPSNKCFMIETLANRLNVKREEVEQVFQSFRNAEYLACCSLLLRPRQGAVELVRRLQEAGYRLALATQPMYGLQEISMRLWGAGLHPGDFQYICSWEKFCHLKPHPGFFTTLMDQVGAAPQECLMVGDNLKHDGAASGLGIDTLILQHGSKLTDITESIPGSSPASDVRASKMLMRGVTNAA